MSVSNDMKSALLSGNTVQAAVESVESQNDDVYSLGPNDRRKIDPDKVARIDEALEKYGYILHKSGRRRALVAMSAPATYSTGTILGSSTSNSVGQLGGTSQAFAIALNHVNKIIDGSAEPGTQHGFMAFLEKIERLSIHRLEDSECVNFEGTDEAWQLLISAATASKRVYTDFSNAQIQTDDLARSFVPARGNLKAFTLDVSTIYDRRVLILAVRGTSSVSDWYTNMNGRPTPDRQLLDGSTMWHKGFLEVAYNMQEIAATLIKDELQQQHVDSILFTGHSAGGAVAQIFFAMANALRLEPLLSRSLDIPEINCITFGTPPVATTCIPHDIELHKPGSFLSVVNEGDPVCLVQEDYIKALLDVYVLSDKDLQDRYHGDFQVPSAVLKFSGTCLVLRDVDPDSIDVDQVKASVVDARVLEMKLFGNPFLHDMDIYLERMNTLLSPL